MYGFIICLFPTLLHQSHFQQRPLSIHYETLGSAEQVLAISVRVSETLLSLESVEIFLESEVE